MRKLQCIMSVIVLLIGMLHASDASAQPPIQWQKCLGGGLDDNARSIRQTADGGYIVIGSALSNDGDVSGNNGFVDYWIAKLDKLGAIQWQKALGGTASDVGYSVAQSQDGSYIVCGYAESANGLVTGNHGYTDFWIIKLSASGALLWQKALGGGFHDNAHSVLSLTNGDYIIAGGVSSTDGDVTGSHGSFDGWVVRLDSDGDVIWKKCYGGSGIDDIDAILPAPGGGYILTGYTLSADGDVTVQKGGGDLWVFKIDDAGNLLWQKTYGGSQIDAGYSVTAAPDGGYMVAGATKSNDGDVSGHHGDLDSWILKLDAAGNLQWQKCFGGSSQDLSPSIVSMPDGGYVVGAQTASTDGDALGNHGGLDYWIFKISGTGALQWQKCFGGSGADMLSDLVPTSDGWYIANGSTTSRNGDVSGLHGGSFDFWVVKFGPDPLCAPAITVSASQNNICIGTPVTFAATVLNGGTAPLYVWKKNNLPVGSNGPTFTTATINNGDIITCAYTTRTSCGRDTTVISNSVVMLVANDITPAVTVTADNTSICQGVPVVFIASASYGTMTPTYQWLLNGASVGSNTSTYTTSTLMQGDKVQCILSLSTPACPGTLEARSNILGITVAPIVAPMLSITASTLQICKGGEVRFSAEGNGGLQANYQWYINDVPTGSSNTTFTSAGLSDGARVKCRMTLLSAAPCFSGTEAVSNELLIKVNSNNAPSILITSSNGDACKGDPIVFTASARDAGTSTSYQWMVNGSPVGTNSEMYASSNFKDGDQVICTMLTNNPNCPVTAPVRSNPLSVVVKPLPVLRFSPPDTTIMAGERITLVASTNTPLRSIQWSPAGALTNAQTLTPNTGALSVTSTYKLEVVAENGCKAGNEVTVRVFSSLYMPGGFTPNGDGKNDEFRIPPGSLISLQQFSIFDRWGNKVFHTSDAAKGWDGTFRGNNLATGTFIYLVQGKVNGAPILLKGTATLIR